VATSPTIISIRWPGSSNRVGRNADDEARATLRRLYPDREVIALDIDPIGETDGGIHCTTQQQPVTI